MAKHTMNNAFRVAAVALALGSAACHGPVAETPPLAGARIGGPFVLTDQDGRRFSSASLAGRYPIFYFGYTFCPDVCPTDMQVLGKAMRLLEKSDPAKAAKFQPLFITVDPARDTPPVLKQFVAAFYPRLMGLTGTQAEIDRVAKQFAVLHSAQAPTAGSNGYLVEHSRVTMLFGPDMKPIALLPTDDTAEAVAAEIGKWVP